MSWCTCVNVLRTLTHVMCITAVLRTVPARIDTSDTVSLPEVVLSMAITMHCPASGIPTPEVTWYRDAAPITQNSSSVTILDSGWRLKIQRAEVSHTARYSCRARNLAGETEKHFDLNVLGECM